MGALWRQRIRWQKSALNDLRRYGLTRVTSLYWVRQCVIYFGLFASLTCWVIMGASFAGHPGFNIAWTAGVLAINFVERMWTVRHGGRHGMVISALMVPNSLMTHGDGRVPSSHSDELTNRDTPGAMWFARLRRESPPVARGRHRAAGGWRFVRGYRAAEAVTQQEYSLSGESRGEQVIRATPSTALRLLDVPAMANSAGVFPVTPSGSAPAANSAEA